jgi:hypothetical protein
MRKKVDHFSDLVDEIEAGVELPAGDRLGVEDGPDDGDMTSVLEPELDAQVPMLRDPPRRVSDAPEVGETGVPDVFKQRVYEMLCSGFSPGQVSVMLYESEKTYVEPVKLSAYFDLIPTRMLLPSTALRRHFFNLNVIADPMAEMQLLLRLEQERLSAMLEAEQDKKKISKAAQSHINSYWRKLTQFTQLKQMMGRMKTVKTQAAEPEKSHIPTMAEIIAGRLADRQTEITVTERKVEIGGRIDDGDIVDAEVRDLGTDHR